MRNGVSQTMHKRILATEDEVSLRKTPSYHKNIVLKDGPDSQASNISL